MSLSSVQFPKLPFNTELPSNCSLSGLVSTASQLIILVRFLNLFFCTVPSSLIFVLHLQPRQHHRTLISISSAQWGQHALFGLHLLAPGLESTSRQKARWWRGSPYELSCSPRTWSHASSCPTSKNNHFIYFVQLHSYLWWEGQPDT